MDVNSIPQGGNNVVKQEENMLSWISCPNGHATKSVSIQDAAMALSEGRTIGACKKCGEELQYRINYTYASDPKEKEYSFVVTRAVGLGTRMNKDNYDPLLLVVRETHTGQEKILPSFGAQAKGGKQRAGQSAPLLALEEWKALFRKLDSGFEEMEQRIRVRA